MDKLIKENPPEAFPAFNHKDVFFHKDKLKYILNLITYLPSIKKDYDYDANGGFVPIMRKLLQNVVDDYKPHIEYLIACGVILENRQYIVGEKSKGLKFTKEYSFVKHRSFFITKSTLIKKILTKPEEEYLHTQTELEYLTKWWDSGKLKINYPALNIEKWE